MNATLKIRATAVVMACQFGLTALNVHAADGNADQSPGQDKFLPQLISGAYGILNVVSTLTEWFSNRPSTQALSNMLTQTNTVGIGPQLQFPASPSTPTFSPLYTSTPIIIGQPDIPLNVGTNGYNATQQWNQNANYQGVQVTVVMLNQSNQPLEARSLNSTFKTGDRFKLQLLSTFDGLASIDAYKTINLSGTPSQAWSGQMYPVKPDQVVKVKAGESVLLPLGANEYFTFDNQAGLDRLMLNMRHQLAKGTQANAQPIYRQDSAQSSTFMQLTPQGTYPALSQVIGFQHAP